MAWLTTPLFFSPLSTLVLDLVVSGSWKCVLFSGSAPLLSRRRKYLFSLSVAINYIGWKKTKVLSRTRAPPPPPDPGKFLPSLPRLDSSATASYQRSRDLAFKRTIEEHARLPSFIHGKIAQKFENRNPSIFQWQMNSFAYATHTHEWCRFSVGRDNFLIVWMKRVLSGANFWVFCGRR